MSYANKDLRDDLKSNLTTVDVFSLYYGLSDFGGGKKYKQVECPACHKKKFTLYDNVCECFGCGTNGRMDIFSLYMFLNNTGDFQQALYGLAKDFNFISQEEYDSFFDKNTNSKKLEINYDVVNERRRLQEEKEKKCPTAKLQSKEVIHNVYSLIKEMYPVTGKQRFSIKKERNLSNERINKEYFRMPYVNDEFYNKLFKAIKDRFGYEPLDLIGVPGFYSQDMKTVKFVKRKGLGLLMSGADNVIQAIQIRAYDFIDDNGNMILKEKFDKEGNKINRAKYYWCGSHGEPNGCSPGSPVDVIIPKKKDTMLKTCFITEGKFKEEIIVEHFNCPSISVQGVGNWEGRIAPELEFISKNFKEMKYAYIAYDADMAFNFKVYNSCKRMALEEILPLNVSVMIVVWDYHFGKGIDNAIVNGYKDKLKAVNIQDFIKVYEIYKTKIMEIYPNSIETKILDENKQGVDSEILYPLYKDIVLKPLGVPCYK